MMAYFIYADAASASGSRQHDHTVKSLGDVARTEVVGAVEPLLDGLGQGKVGESSPHARRTDVADDSMRPSSSESSINTAGIRLKNHLKRC